MVYNPDDEEKRVNFYRSGELIKSVKAPSRKITAFDTDPYLNDILVGIAGGAIIPPGGSSLLTATLIDQYGATFDTDAPVEFSSSDPRLVSIDTNGKITVTKDAPLGSKVTISARCKEIWKEYEIEVNELPRVVKTQINGIPQYIEVGSELNLKLIASDQYGNAFEPECMEWRLTGIGENRIIDSKFIPVRPGSYVLVGVGQNPVDGSSVKAEAVLKILPALPSVSLKGKAISSSEENVGSVTGSVNDGDISSRWGSAHNENEWILIDLGEDTYISNCSILWEAAYGADYDLQVAPEGARMTTHKGNYAGTQKSVTVPEEEAWVTVAEVRGVTKAGKVETPLDANGRYFRMKGLRRGTGYGYSIYEMILRGLPMSLSENEIVGIGFDLPAVLEEGERTRLVPKAYTRNAVEHDIDVEWSADKNAEFIGNDFIPREDGLFVVKASAQNGASGEMSVFVNEGIRLSTVSLSPTSSSIIEGDSVEITAVAQNQFGGVYPLTDLNLQIRITEVMTGQIVDESVASYSPFTGIFTSDKKGKYKIVMNPGGGVAIVDVVDLTEANLALGKPVIASSSVGGNLPSNINDGDIKTRWESPQRDGEWVAVDLRTPFILDHAVLEWEAAYDTRYDISISIDGDNWWRISTYDNGKGGREILALPAIPAGWIRLNCNKRATDYGSSLFELEVYGKDRFALQNDFNSPIIRKGEAVPGNGSVRVNLSADDDSGYVFGRAELYAEWGDLISAETFVAFSGEEKNIVFSGLHDGRIYRVKLCMEDPFGNRTDETLEFMSYLDIAGQNIALSKNAGATSCENNGLGAEKAVDGDKQTRWGSKFNDGEEFRLDLGDVYSIETIRIYWDGVAYATDYLVEGSEDGVGYMPIFSRTSWSGTLDEEGCRVDQYSVPVKTYARYLRLRGDRRATQYGTSIREFEVYAENDFSHSGVAALGHEEDRTCKYVDGVYNLQGIRISGGDNDDVIRALPSGYYIIRGKKVRISGR